MSDEIEKTEGEDEAVTSASAADPASTEPEAASSTDSPQGSSSEDDATASTASDDAPVAEEAGEDAPVDEERASEDADEAPAAEASEDADEAPAAEASEDADEAPAADADEDEPVAEVEDEPAEKKPAKASRPKRADRAASTPRRQRERKERETDPTRPAPVVRAQAKYVRSSARKARLVCDHIRGKSVVEARAILALTPRAIARDWSKLLESAVANAEHNHELVGEDLVVKAVHADEGPTIKRFRPRAMGRATPIRKRTSHLTILLTPKD
jgi:ribosomal protein L22